MPSAIDATIGGAAANSYETLAEANTYQDDRLALNPPWVTSGSTAIRALLMATRNLEQFGQSIKLLVPPSNGVAAYYRVARHWNGSPASATQRLSWPRVGLFDNNGNPLDWTIDSASVASPTVIVTKTAHGRTSGQKVFITDSDTTPSIDGERTVTVLSTTSFSIPVAVTVAGTKGSVSIIPQELKDAESEFAGQLLKSDVTLNNDVIVQGITSVRAGSVALTFKDQIFKQVIPDAVLDLLVPGWLTDEEVVPAWPAQFDMMSNAPEPWPEGRW